MKHLLTTLSLGALLLMGGPTTVQAEKVTVPLTEDGAWSFNSQPSAVYYNGKTYFTWISSSKALIVASYDHTTGETKEKVVSTGYSDDFSSPAITVRGNGQLLLFSSDNKKENGFYSWYSTNAEDITEWSSSQKQTGYGISSTTPHMVGNDLVVFWRSKNNIGYSLFTNVADKTGNLPAVKTRAGFIGSDIGNAYAKRDEVPQMRTYQAADGTIHMVVTHLGTGLTYKNSTVHYLKINKNATGDKLEFKKADGTAISGMNVTESKSSELDVIAKGEDTNKVWAYDIALDASGNPVVLYDAFTAAEDGTTTGHTYYYARWNGTAWESTAITTGDGVPMSEYKAVEGNIFKAKSYQAGGICFGANDLNTVYLSKKAAEGTFEIYRYETTDNGATWAEKEVITSGTPAGELNIRPIAIKDAPADVFWMQGMYDNPTNYKTSISCAGEGVATTGIFFGQDSYEFVANETTNLDVRFAPLFATDKEYTLESSNTGVVEITADGKVLCKATGEATITAKLKNNASVSTTCKVTVLGESVYKTFINRIITDVVASKISTIDQLDKNVASYLTQLQDDGSFPDIDYASDARTDWPPMQHLDRLLAMGLAYTQTESKYYGNDELKAKMDLMLTYWHSKQPSSNNWYQNQIGEPQRMGQYLIVMQNLGKEKISEDLFNKSIARLKNKGGSPSSQTGANRVDVALHWMYRACLTEDDNLMREAMDQIYSTIEYTTGAEGIQYDNSFTQHGHQLHIGAYGDVFLDGITKACSYAAGTRFTVTGQQLDILSSLVNTYIGTIRGGYMSYNVIGRSSTRPGATKKGTGIIERMIALDPANTDKYEKTIARINGTQQPSYGLEPRSTHFFRGDYTLHQRPEYTVDLRLVSTRTARNEYLKDNGEGIKQYFMSDGSTAIMVKGNEYYNIFPVWNYAKVPGVTCPEFTEIPQASTYIKMGQSAFAGGVTDSLCSVSAYKYIDNEFNINSSANKAWFFFDKEIVCLGNSIKSASEFQVNTTVNQCLLDGDVVVSSNGSESTLQAGDYNYEDNLDWAFHGNVGYYFPQKGKLQLNAGERTGNWYDINTNYADETVKNNVFTLSFNHGTQPTDGSYAYIIVPGISKDDAKAYKSDNVEIIINTDSVQAVYHKELKMYGLVFYKSAGFSKHGLTVEADAGCVVLVKDADKAETVVYISDPTNGSSPINLGIETPAVKGRRLVTYQSEAPYQGRSMKFVVNENTPASTGRDVLADRSAWTITTSLAGPADATVGGDDPKNIIDDSTVTSFLFVKPGKTFSGIEAPADYIPSFTIDMQTPQEIEYFVYRHRDYSNTTASLRANRISFYGKNNEADEFTPVLENITLDTSVAENKILLPNKVSFRYIKVTITDYDKINSSTIQVSDFNIGKKTLMDIPESGDPTGITEVKAGNSDFTVSVYPNPVKQGEQVQIIAGNTQGIEFKLYDTTGSVRAQGNTTTIDTNSLSQGIYILHVTDKAAGQKATAKFIVH